MKIICPKCKKDLFEMLQGWGVIGDINTTWTITDRKPCRQTSKVTSVSLDEIILEAIF